MECISPLNFESWRNLHHCVKDFESCSLYRETILGMYSFFFVRLNGSAVFQLASREGPKREMRYFRSRIDKAFSGENVGKTCYFFPSSSWVWKKNVNIPCDRLRCCGGSSSCVRSSASWVKSVPERRQTAWRTGSRSGYYPWNGKNKQRTQSVYRRTVLTGHVHRQLCRIG